MSTIIPLLLERLHTRRADIEGWFDAEFAKTPASFYSSVDLRHSGTKLAPVDTNLFPAGFNNLSIAARARATQAVRDFVAQSARPIAKVLLIPENHTRNLGYLDNLNVLIGILRDVGLEVCIGSLAAQAGEPLELEGSDGTKMTQKPLKREGNFLLTEHGFKPDLIVVNNDMTSGMPSLLRGVTQLVVPQVGQGWYRRKKTIHFEAYEQTATRFAQAFDLDPWLIAASFHQCGRIDFHERKGIECVALGVEKILNKVRGKYAEYGIDDEPYVYIKADSGTYGMGIMTVRSGEELYEMNKKIRNKMNVIKEGVQSTEVIIQEGVPTVDRVDGAIAEPMIYLVNGHAVGGAFRVNEERDPYGNLNAKGMHFAGMCDEAEAKDSSFHAVKNCDFSVYGLVSRLATLAASREEYGESYSI